MLKAAIKHGASEDQIRHRIVPPEAVAKWTAKLEGTTQEVAEILREEKEEKQVSLSFSLYALELTPTPIQFRQAEMELKKGQNIIEHETEIFSRPARTWFQTGKEKQNAQGIVLPTSRVAAFLMLFPMQRSASNNTKLALIHRANGNSRQLWTKIRCVLSNACTSDSGLKAALSS